MRGINQFLFAFFLLISVPAFSADEDRLSFFEVGLACKAAPKIGCGGRAKPVLKEMLEQPPVAEAWLNHAGTVLAVKWKPNQTPPRKR